MKVKNKSKQMNTMLFRLKKKKNHDRREKNAVRKEDESCNTKEARRREAPQTTSD